MNKYDIRLIALDLDDTLLNDDRQISDGNVAALRECAERGIYVVLCSGRAEDAILPFVRRLEIAGKEQKTLLQGVGRGHPEAVGVAHCTRVAKRVTRCQAKS